MSQVPTKQSETHGEDHNTHLPQVHSVTYTKLLGVEMSALVSLTFFFPPWLLRLVVERLPKPENTSAPGWPLLEEAGRLEGDVGPRLMAGRERDKRHS